MEKKRSLKLLIVSACLALLLVSIGGIIVGANEPVTVNEELVIKGASLDLNDKISIAFAVKADTIGYEKDKALKYAVEVYDTNPGTKAGNGTTLTSTKVKTIADEEYVLFFTEGYAAPDYSDTVYARLVGNGEYGPIVKTGVLEMANRQLASYNAKLAAATTDSDKDFYNTRVKLYTAIINYGINADLVVSKQTEYNYSFITIADGYIVDDAGYKWTSGVYANGTKLNVVPTPDKDFGVPTTWTDGTTTYSSSDFTVVADAALTLKGYDMSTVDTNPIVSNWSSASTESWDQNRIKQYIANQATAIYPAINRDPTKAVAGKEGSIYLNENGSITYLSTLAQRYYKDSTTMLGFTGGTGTTTKTQNFSFTTTDALQSDEPLTLSFTLNFPANDLNNNGITYDYGPLTYTQEVQSGEDGAGEPIYTTQTLYANGDMFRGTGNPVMIRFPLVVGDTTLMHIGFYANSKTVDGVNVVDSWSLRTAVGSADGNVNIDSKKYDISVPHDIDVELVPNTDTGAVKAVNIYVDGELCVTHTDAGTGKFGLQHKNNVFKAETKPTVIMQLMADCGRFCGDYEVSNVQLKYNNSIDASELKANYSKGAIIAGYAADKTTPHYAWSDLVDGEKHAFLTGTTDNKNWYYDAYTDSVIVTKASASAGYGAMNFLIANPLYGKQNSYNGEKAVFEFTMNMLPMDTNKDGKFNTVLDVKSSTGSSVWGQMNIGYGDGIYDYTRAFSDGGAAARTLSGIMDSNGVLGNFRISKNNSGTATSINNYNLIYYNQKADSGSGIGTIYHGTYVTLKFVVTPDAATGKPKTLEIYANGKLITTRTNDLVAAAANDANDKAGFTWCSSNTGANNNFFNAPYFEFSQFIRADGYQSTSYSNFSSWSE